MNALPRAGVRALVVLALGAALGLCWLGRTSRPSGAAQVARSANEVATPAPSVVLAPPASVPRGEVPRVAARPAPAATSAPIEVRCERVVSELAGWLDAPEFDRAEWQRRLRAHARSLSGESGAHERSSREDAVTALLAMASDENGGAERRVCAAELLRALQASSGAAVPAPSPGALACLRAAAADPARSDPLAEAAACSLAALGTELDARQLLAGLLHGESPERERAAVALPFVFHAGGEVALELARALATDGLRANGMEAGLSVLDGLVRGGRALDASTIAAELDALARNPRLEPRARRRVIATLARLAPGSPALEASLAGRDPELAGAAAFELAAGSTEEGARSLAVALAAAGSEPDGARRATLARALAYAPGELPGDSRTMALAELHALARDPQPGARRSAVLALAASADLAGASLVAEVARFDPDATVRASAVRALRGLERAVAVDAWSACARNDPDATVRALAEQELRRLDARSSVTHTASGTPRMNGDARRPRRPS